MTYIQFYSSQICYKSNTLYAYINMVLSLMKSQCSGFSTSTTPHGYILPLIFLPRISIVVLDPTTANGTAFCKVNKKLHVDIT